jgi:Na+/H+ antiporter NhaD/arsenite permease-like protein
LGSVIQTLSNIALLAAAAPEETLTATTDAVSQGLAGVIIALAFVLLVMEKAHRVLVIFSAVALLLTITYLTPYHLITFSGAKEALDLNVLLLLASMMAVVGVLKTTGVFPWSVTRLLERAGGRPHLIQLLIVWFTGVVSAFADNVTTVIFLTPMAIEIARRTKVRPVVYLLPMIMAANIGGAATLIGDPPNILIGSGAGLSFMDFIVDLTMPIAWMMLMLAWFTRRYFAEDLAAGGGTDEGRGASPAIVDPTLLKWSGVASVLIFAGFVTHGMTGMPVAVPALIGAAFLLVVQDVLYLRRRKPTHEERVHGLLEVIEKEIEWPTLSFFAFLFIAVGAAVDTGLIRTAADGLTRFITYGSEVLRLSPAGSLLFAAIIICWASGIFSAIIDNIPFVAVAIPIVASLVGEMPGDTEVLWWALALGACLGGNGSPIGASANVTVLGLSEKEGTWITFGEFMRMGVPVTALTLLMSSAFLAGYVFLGDILVLKLGTAGLAVFAGVRFLVRRSRVAQASG